MERFLCGSRAIFPLRVFGSSCASKSVACLDWRLGSGSRREIGESRGERGEGRVPLAPVGRSVVGAW